MRELNLSKQVDYNSIEQASYVRSVLLWDPSSSYTTVLWCCVPIYMYKHLDIFNNFNSVFWKIFCDIARFSFFFSFSFLMNSR